MKIIISPAKKMNIQEDHPFEVTTPVFLEEAKELRKSLQTMDFKSLQSLWNCSEKLVRKNMEELLELDLTRQVTPALLAYEGIQYQYMAPQIFTTEQWKYVTEHLRILCGFYGVLKPSDGVIPYRLEMQSRMETTRGKDLYAFWEKRIYEELVRDESVIVNLASKEYSKAVEAYKEENIQWIDCIFGERKDGKIKVKGTLAKMARGEMVRWMAENQIENVEDIKAFQGLDFVYEPDCSSEENLVFLQREKKTPGV